jgi:hypothetical protein
VSPPTPTPGGGIGTPSAPNTSVFPPSRLLPTPAPSAAAPGQPGNPPAGAVLPGAPSGPDPNLPATASGARPQPGGANSSEQSIRNRTGKNPSNERYADCVKLWDRETHMSKADWSRTCRRIENRLQNVQLENLDVDVSGPKPRKTGKSPGGSG